MSKWFLGFFLFLMLALIGVALAFPVEFEALLDEPEYYIQAKFIHVLSITIVFANALIGTIWETRSLFSNRIELVRFTYKTTVWMDATFTAPLIITAVVSGLLLATVRGGVWETGWLSLAFLVFAATGLVWIFLDIPGQYRINRILDSFKAETGAIPAELKRVLRQRMIVNAMGTLPLLFIFYLMVQKPAIPEVAEWKILPEFTQAKKTP